MNYHHLTIEERSCIRKYYVDGLSYREIARLIGRNVSTVSRELRRNCTHMYDIPTYYPHTAQKKYLLRRSYCHRGMFRSQEVIEYIRESQRPAPGVLSERQKPFPCRSRHAKTKPGVDKRQASQSSELPFSPGAMGL